MSDEKRELSEDEQRLLAYVKTIMTTSVRGMMAGNPRVRSEMFLIISSMALGQLCGELYIGDELAVFKFRKLCREAFADFMRVIPVQPIQKTDDTTDTAALNRG